MSGGQAFMNKHSVLTDMSQVMFRVNLKIPGGNLKIPGGNLKIPRGNLLGQTSDVRVYV